MEELRTPSFPMPHLPKQKKKQDLISKVVLGWNPHNGWTSILIEDWDEFVSELVKKTCSSMDILLHFNAILN